MVEQFYQSDCFSMNPTTVLSQRVGKEKESATKPFIGVKTMPFISGCSSYRQRKFFSGKSEWTATSFPRVPRLLRLSSTHTHSSATKMETVLQSSIAYCTHLPQSPRDHFVSQQVVANTHTLATPLILHGWCLRNIVGKSNLFAWTHMAMRICLKQDLKINFFPEVFILDWLQKTHIYNALSMSIEHQTIPWFCRCCKLDWRAYSWEKVEKEGSVWWNILSIVGRLGSPRKWGIGFMFPPSQLAVSGRIQYHQHHDTSTGWFSALLLHPFKSLPPTPRALPMFSELAPTVL